MLESVVSARGKVLRTNFSATSRVTRATKLTQAASRHSYRWCSPPTRGSATCAFYLFIRQPMGRKSALRREIPWILRGFQGRLSC